jgi:hypothetical protein
MKNIQRLCVLCGAIVLATSFAWHLRESNKINGVSFVAPSRYIDQKVMAPLLDVKANWTAITPYAFSSGNTAEVVFGHNRQWWGEGKSGTIATISYAKALGLKVMLKPHVWVRGQGWAGDFQLDTDAEWDAWGKSYSEYILTFAKIADSLHVEMLCIGTEYRKSASQRPDIWRKLIRDVRKIYSGSVVYAANWDNYEHIEFWDQLDYIGIDAYFPMSTRKSPHLAELNNKWQSTKNNIEAFSKRWDKPVLFTEFGYQSIDYASDGHWNYDQDTLSVNLKNQATAYQAIFDTFWEESWFHGGFLWKWHSDHANVGGAKNKRFTPQNKPAQQTITDWYGRY